MNQKQQLVCPVCGFRRLIDSDMNTKSELKSEKEICNGWRADYYQKCPKCRNQIGIKKIS